MEACYMVAKIVSNWVKGLTQLIILDFLEKPKCFLSKIRQLSISKIWKHLRYHFRISQRNRQVLLAYTFPTHTAQLIHLVNQ